MTKGNGKTIRWVQDHQHYPHKDWCLIWPYSRTRGYGTFSYLGKHYYAHRYMCELVHGAPPTPDHQAAHSCGNGVEGCANPNHLSWKTQSENQLDCREHGTQAKHHTGRGGHVTPEQAHQIRMMKGVKLQREIAEEFNISESTVSDIWLGRTHARPPKIKPYTPEEDAQIREAIARGCNFTEIGKLVGRPTLAVTNRAYRLGLKSGQPVRKIMP